MIETPNLRYIEPIRLVPWFVPAARGENRTSELIFLNPKIQQIFKMVPLKILLKKKAVLRMIFFIAVARLIFTYYI